MIPRSLATRAGMVPREAEVLRLPARNLSTSAWTPSVGGIRGTSTATVLYREADDQLELPRTYGRTCRRRTSWNYQRFHAAADEATATSSPSMVAKKPCAMLGCERCHEQWIDEFESFVYLQCAVDPAEHRHRLESPICPGACACRPVDRKEVKASQAAEEAIQQEWDRLRSREAREEDIPRGWDDVPKRGHANPGRGSLRHGVWVRCREEHGSSCG